MMQLMTQTMALATRAFSPPATQTMPGGQAMPSAAAGIAAEGGQTLDPAEATASAGGTAQRRTVAGLAADAGNAAEGKRQSGQAAGRQGLGGAARTAGAAVAGGLAASGAAIWALMRGKHNGKQSAPTCDVVPDVAVEFHLNVCSRKAPQKGARLPLGKTAKDTEYSNSQKL